jgi:hypothetical protein
MDCDSFEVSFNDMLNGVLPDSEREEVMRHRDSCGKCKAFAHDMESLDHLLRTLPPVDVRAEFREKLYRMALKKCPPYVSWRPYILRWLSVVVPVSLAFALGRFLPGLPWEIAQVAILLGTCLFLFFESIWPRQNYSGYRITEILSEHYEKGGSLDRTT